MESCEAQAIQGAKSRPAYQVVLLSVLLQGVTGVLHSYYTGDTQVLHSCCMGVTRVLQGCNRDVTASLYYPVTFDPFYK